MASQLKKSHLSDEACCTCATRLSEVRLQYDEKTEKPVALDRSLDCCGRVICGNCIANNSRFASYCPFCQISTHPTPLPQRLHDPPSYDPSSVSSPLHPPSYVESLPPYTPSATSSSQPTDSKTTTSEPAEDVLHFLNHSADTLLSLSLRYNVPLAVLRKHNNITSDHLLLARRAVLIPGEYYQGESLSARPVEGEEEERRKVIVRKWMVACKVAEYDVALLYLEQANYDLELAIDVYKDDERWEKENPLQGKGKGKATSRSEVGRRRFTGQKN